ncbi:hypothetical protein GOV13_02385 [Candidatus Pacearchaeota archaeon]|nr:hypothetical protein [Candidatus Pacearchaeota archaeon]
MKKRKSEIFTCPNRRSHLNKRGLSNVITGVILIGIALSAVGIGYFAIQNVINDAAENTVSKSSGVSQETRYGWGQTGFATWAEGEGGDVYCDDCSVGIGTDSPQNALDVVGDLNVTGEIFGLPTEGEDNDCHVLSCGENSALDNAAWEWSCGGNGETGDDLGVYAFRNLTITGIGLNCLTATGTANVTMTIGMAYVTCSTPMNSNTYSGIAECNVDVNKGDVMLPRTVIDTGHSNCVVSWEVCRR